MTKTQFVTTAPAPVAQIGGYPVNGTPKAFSTGSVGFNFNGKVPYLTADGKPVLDANGKPIMLQVSGNAVVIKSGEWAE